MANAGIFHSKVSLFSRQREHNFPPIVWCVNLWWGEDAVPADGWRLCPLRLRATCMKQTKKRMTRKVTFSVSKTWNVAQARHVTQTTRQETQCHSGHLMEWSSMHKKLRQSGRCLLVTCRLSVPENQRWAIRLWCQQSPLQLLLANLFVLSHN